jgi:preprotein translocase subunit YajC
MDKFLLLRDNKQTGPYSAADLEKMGLKSYDLIWVDGKSAAWRYPGEIDALKSFAPPVEEQPYDRFYKKDFDTEQPKEFLESASHKTDTSIHHDNEQNYIPPVKPKEIFAEEKKDTEKVPSKHIFVSIPKRKSEEVKKIEPAEKIVYSNQIDHAAYLPPVNPTERFPDRSPERSLDNPEFITASYNTAPTRPSIEFVSGTDEKPQSVNTKRNKGFNPVYLMAAALFLFALISVFLYMNYKEQNKQLNRLNEIVLNMQQGEEMKTTTPVYNAVAPVLHQESLSIDTLGARNMNVTETERSPEEKIAQKKPFIKKSAKADSIVKEPVIREPVEIIPVPVNNTAGSGRTVKRRVSTDQLKISTNDFKVGFLGGISGLQVTLANNGDAPMEKVDVAVEYLSKENKVVKTQVITFKNLAPGAALTQDVPRVARGITVRCKVEETQTSESVASTREPAGKTP